MPCIVDKESMNEIYDSCVLDYNKPEDCDLSKDIKTKYECKFWIKNEHKICQYCNQKIEN
jgi:hypothetical protein